eukprot:8170851-Pyramimonas_sp.AAC.1
MWKAFVKQAEVTMIDACGLIHELDRYSGRAERPRLAATSATAPSPPRLPRATRASTWRRAIAICLLGAAQIERPFARLGALRALGRLASRPPSDLTELQGVASSIASGAQDFSFV